LQDYADLDVFIETNKIIQKLKEKKCDDALVWCNQHKTKLTKSNSNLEFNLRVLDFVDQIKNNNFTEAITYAKTHLSKFSATNMEDI
jgi:macrophage erythroblast attacher